MGRVLGKYDRLASWNFNEEKIENKQDKISIVDYFCEKNGRFTQRHGREKKELSFIRGSLFGAKNLWLYDDYANIFWGDNGFSHVRISFFWE